MQQRADTAASNASNELNNKSFRGALRGFHATSRREEKTENSGVQLKGKDMHNNVTPKQLRSFGLIVGTIFAVIGLWPAIWRYQEPRLWALALASLLIVPALVFPRSLRRVYQVWMALGAGLGWINTRIILSILFYGLMTPMGLLMRMRGKDPMRRHWERDAKTYRVVRQPRPSSHMTHQF